MSALAIHWLTINKSASGGGFIGHAAVLMSRVSDSTEDALGFFEPLGTDDEYIERITQAAEHLVQVYALVECVRRRASDNQEIDVAVASHRSGRSRPEENDPVRPDDIQQPPHNLLNQTVIDTHHCHPTQHARGKSTVPMPQY